MPLNERQKDVLAWVVAGCPARNWPDHTYKTVAVALQSRGLVQISKPRGIWQALPTDAGTYYITNGHLPEPARRQTPARRLQRAEQRIKPAADTSKSTRAQHDSKTPTSASESTTAEASELVNAVIAAGGELRRIVKGQKRRFAALVDVVNDNGLAIDGHRLVMTHTDNNDESLFSFEALPRWLSARPRDVVNAARINRWHAVVSAIRSEKRLRATPLVADRALRILQSIANEAEARGHTVALPEWRKDRHGYTQKVDSGHLIIRVRTYRYSVELSQRDDYTPHTPTAEELRREKANSWDRPRRWDTTPGERLRVRVSPIADRRGWHRHWDDSKTMKERVEDSLPAIMLLLEADADGQDDRKEADRLRVIAAAKRREEAEMLSIPRHHESLRVQAFANELAAWKEHRANKRYLKDLAKRVSQIENDDARLVAVEWLDWCRRYVAGSDPLALDPVPPVIRNPTWSEKHALVEMILAEG
ncbi:hypothetical protein ACHIPZ_06550 [Antrihabitans sp. NCIMB 15449]|uniref:PE-PGRS family protein n=1 Tax=Antrihabitans spumae TaxID=3373370 RepID=A0ABW7JKZ6_9NOCA